MLQRLPLIGALATVFIGVLGLTGWVFGIPRLLRVWNGAPAMASDTAVLLIVAGAGLLAVLAGQKRSALVCGTFLVSAATACKVTANHPAIFVSLHRFFPVWTATVLGTADPLLVRMILPATLILMFVVFGIALIGLALGGQSPWALWTAAASGAALASIGSLGVLAIVCKLRIDPEQNTFLTQTSPLTALSAFIMGVSLCALFGARYRFARERTGITVAVLGLLALVLLSAGMDYAILSGSGSVLKSRVTLARASARVAAVETLVQAAQEANIGVQGFLSTGDAKYLAGYGAGASLIRKEIDAMPSPAGANAIVLRFRNALQQELEELAAGVEARQAGQAPGAAAMAHLTRSQTAAQDVMRTSREIVEAFKLDAKRSLDRNSDTVVLVQRTVICSFVVSTLLVGAALYLVIAEYWRWSARQNSQRETELMLERRVAEAQESMRTTLEFSEVAAWTWDPHKDTVVWNGPVDRVTGVATLNSYAHFRERVHPEDRERVDELLRDTATSGADYDTEFRVVMPDGNIRWLAGRGGASFHEGRLIQLTGVNFDITRAKRIEIELKEREAQFRHLANAMPQIVWQALPDGALDVCNERWYEVTGLPAGSRPDRKWMRVLHPDDRRLCMRTWQKCVRSGDPFALEMRLKEGNRYRWYLSRSIPVRGRDGQIVRWFGTTTDIHEQKVAKENLEAEVQHRTEDLRRTLREKDVLFQEVHHRVKNNLQIINSLLRMQGEAVGDIAAQISLEEARQRVFSMALIHERLYSHKRMDALDFGEYARALVDSLIASYSNSGRHLALVTSPRIVLELDQAIPCGLILNELVSNALKYAYPEGSGEIAVELTEDESKIVALTVADRGVGLPADFDPDSSESLGMSIVQTLAHQLGGSFHFRSSYGAKFTVQFVNSAKTIAVTHPADALLN